MAWLLILSVAAGCYVAWSALCLARNYLLARKTGFPILVVPIDAIGMWWLILSNSGVFSPWLAEHAPRFLWHRLRFLSFNGAYLDRFRPYETLEPAIMIVTPGSNHLWVHEPTLGDLILARRKDFVASEMTQTSFSLYGPSVITSDGDDWLRYRKLFTKGINEKILRRTWDETVRQTGEMTDYFLRPSNRRTTEMIPSVQKLAVNIQISVQYDINPPWEQTGPAESPSLVQQVSQDIKTILPLYFVITALPAWILTMPRRFLTLPFLAQSIGNAVIAARSIPGGLLELIDVEREALQSPDTVKNTFLSNMLQFLEVEKASLDGSEAQKALTEKELVANLFLFTLASFDTTANTISFAIAMLAIYPEWQDWILEEIDSLAAGSNPLTVKDFTRMPRCMALLNETLRVFSAAGQMPRCTAGFPKTLHLKEATYNVPAGTQIWVAFARMQHNRTAWGPDHLAFRPSRFTDPSSPEAEQVQRRHFLPWSRGPRQCPGMKIAQIEFVAVIVTILSRARVECARLAGETVEMAAKRTMRAVRNSSQAVALQVNKPRDVVIVWKERLRSGNA